MANPRGFTLVETLVGVALFAIVALTGYTAYTSVFRAVQNSHTQTIMASLANEQFEIVRNLPYAQVGVVSGLPVGVIPHVQSITRSGVAFTVTTTIRNVDDPFDGVIGGTPNDTAPADYKLVEVEIACAVTCDTPNTIYTTQVGPRALESTGNNGALFVRVFNASGQPVSDANVHVLNQQPSPDIVIDDVTPNDGVLQIVDTPPGTQVYEVSVSKPGYSSERTYPVGAVGNPNPAKPHATVATGQVTQLSFAIDRVGSIQASSVDKLCRPVGNTRFHLQGSKLIGSTPDVVKYDADHVTSATGTKAVTGLEWDTYKFSFTDTVLALSGLLPLSPIPLQPAGTQVLTMVVEPRSPSNLLVTLRDAETGLPVSDATVQVLGGAYNQTLQTGRNFVLQSDWSGGGGQGIWLVDNQYSSSNNVATPAASLTLAQSAGLYLPSGTLTSSTFDLGSSATTFYKLFWDHGGTGTVRLQLASNNDNATWNFVGPDGSSGSYYTTGNETINAVHNGQRYLRYRVYLDTADTTVAPTAGEIGFWFTGPCVPPGQLFFGGLANGTYTVNVTKTGYQSVADTATVSAGWQEKEILLTPNP